MQIFGPFRVSTATPASGPQRTSSAKPAEPSAPPRGASTMDKLDISNHANRLESAASPTVGGDIRIDRVADLRRQIASGNYDTPEKLDVALSRFLDDFA